jgi:hypothetical protein
VLVRRCSVCKVNYDTRDGFCDQCRPESAELSTQEPHLLKSPHVVPRTDYADPNTGPDLRVFLENQRPTGRHSDGAPAREARTEGLGTERTTEPTGVRAVLRLLKSLLLKRR